MSFFKEDKKKRKKRKVRRMLKRFIIVSNDFNRHARVHKSGNEIITTHKLDSHIFIFFASLGLVPVKGLLDWKGFCYVFKGFCSGTYFYLWIMIPPILEITDR